MSERGLLVLVVAAFCVAVGVVVYLVVGGPEPASPAAFEGESGAVGGRPPRPRTFKVRKPLRRSRTAEGAGTEDRGSAPQQAPAGSATGDGKAPAPAGSGTPAPEPRPAVRTTVPAPGRR